MTPPLDVVLYGATGFTGRQTVEYFRDHAPGHIAWAIAGRNAAKLAALAGELALPPTVERIVAEASDTAALEQIARRTRVVLSTAGPFALYGEGLIAACARNGTHYVDITGETWWVREMIDRYEPAARASMAKLFPFCGFDSVPSDMAVFLAQERIRAAGDETREATGFFHVRGGLNGGSFLTGLNMFSSNAEERALDPGLLLPPDAGGVRLVPDPDAAFFDEDVKSWVAPFFMGMVNTRVVNRSAALFNAYGESYGPAFTYREYQKLGGLNPLPALGMAAALKTFRVLGRVEMLRNIAGALGPGPGEGPSEAERKAGYSEIEVIARGHFAETARVRMACAGDPGNRATVLFVCEAALCIARRPPAWASATATVCARRG